MKRIKLEVAYDGTDYCGWQIQPKDKTIEGVLNKTLSLFLGEEITVIGASRTDSGVHALGNVAVFDSRTRISGERIARALNQKLPDDIVIQSSKEVADDFHPRYQDTRKTYEYTIYNADFDNPVTARHHHFVYVPLDVERMRKASEYFLGEHDYISFSTTGSQTKTTVRIIYECEVKQDGPYITMRVTGNGFLYNMVRMMAGTLISIGKGRRDPEWIKELFENPQRGKAGPNAPAKGLTLIKIRYMDEEKDVD